MFCILFYLMQIKTLGVFMKKLFSFWVLLFFFPCLLPEFFSLFFMPCFFFCFCFLHCHAFILFYHKTFLRAVTWENLGFQIVDIQSILVKWVNTVYLTLESLPTNPTLCLKNTEFECPNPVLVLFPYRPHSSLYLHTHLVTCLAPVSFSVVTLEIF